MRHRGAGPAFWLMALAALCLTTTTVFAADRWALLIGVNKCKAIGELKTSVADARAMQYVLQQVGYSAHRIIVLVDDRTDPSNWPTLANIRRAIRHLARVAETGDTILLFFSGHGITRQGNGYLVPTDGDRENAIPLSWVRHELSQSKAKTRVVILDACHAGAAKGVNGIVSDVRAEERLVMFLSCKKGQMSWPDERKGHSVFTQYLLEGLGGKAAGRDRRVTHVELYEYVAKRVKAWTFKERKPLQEPILLGQTNHNVILAQCPKRDVLIQKSAHRARSPEDIRPTSSAEGSEALPVRTRRSKYDILDSMIPSSAKEVSRSGGVVRITSRMSHGRLNSKRKYRPPFAIRARVMTGSINVRLFCEAGMVCFNWEQDRTSLRIHDPITAKGVAVAGKGALSLNEWHDIVWEIGRKGMRVSVDRKVIYQARGNYSKLRATVGIGSAYGGEVLVRSFEVLPPR